jgi:hypothetical protein
MANYSITVDATQSDSFTHQGKETLKVIATGGFGGGTLKLQFLAEDQTTWTDFPGASWTAAAAQQIAVEGPKKFRYDMSGATTPTVTLELN